MKHTSKHASDTPLRAAVVQDCAVVFDAKASVEKVHTRTKEAAQEGAKLVVFPEAFVAAYPKGLDFGARIGMRTPEGREDYQRYYESAILVPGEETEAMGKAARAAGVYMVIGVIEREGGTIYCTVLTFAPDGQLAGKRRKLMPTAMERLVWGFGDGSTLQAVASPYGAIGSVICWENYMPALRMTMYDQGVALYCTPTADDRDTWMQTVRHIALEGRCFVLSACQYLTRADCPADYDAVQGNDGSTVIMRGGSCIISPMGEVLAGPNYDGPAILTADLDMGAIARGKYDFDAVGHYSRPDVFTLHVNTSARRAVENAPRPAVVSQVDEDA